MNNECKFPRQEATEKTPMGGDESLIRTPVTAEAPDATGLWQDAVYECWDTALWRKRLVLTPHMLLDRLKVCADLLNVARRADVAEDSRNQQVVSVSEEIDHLLHLLWRGGLWTNADTVEKTACDGRTYRVLSEPFTDGKPQGKPLSANAPTWLKEVLGVGQTG